MFQGLLPLPDRHGPFAGGFANGHEDDFQSGFLVGVDLPLANRTVDRFDGVGGVDRPSDRWRKVEQRDDFGSLSAPRLRDGRIFLAPGLSETHKGLLRLQCGRRSIDLLQVRRHGLAVGRAQVA